MTLRLFARRLIIAAACLLAIAVDVSLAALERRLKSRRAIG